MFGLCCNLKQRLIRKSGMRKRTAQSRRLFAEQIIVLSFCRRRSPSRLSGLRMQACLETVPRVNRQTSPTWIMEGWSTTRPETRSLALTCVESGGAWSVNDVNQSLIYPYTANDDQEQHIRARKLESLGVVELLHPEMLAPEVLAPKIAGMFAKTPVRLQVDMDGAANTVRILKSAVPVKLEKLSFRGLSKAAR